MDSKKKRSLALKLLLLLFKTTVLAACLVYLAWCASHISSEHFKASYIKTIAIAAVLYCTCTFILMTCWWLILTALDGKSHSPQHIARIYFKSALAKYIPSNVMHYTARHYMCAQLGISQKTILLSNFIEIALTLMSAVAVLGILIGTSLFELPEKFISDYGLFYKLGIVGLCCLILLPAIAVYLKIKATSTENYQRTALRLTVTFFLYCVFFAATGVILFYIYKDMSIAGDGSGLLFPIMFAYICSWTLGSITPGASGGLGVRESVMVALLSPELGTENAFVGAIVFRLVTVSGELLGYLYAILKKCPLPENKPQ